MLAAPITEGFFDPAQHSVDDLAALVATRTDLRRYPHATDLVREVVVYEATTFERAADAAADDPAAARSLMVELTEVLRDGPGVILVRGAVARPVVERTVEVLWRILERQRAESNATGDHFAMAGTNDRIWNAVEKLALADPACFVDYYASPTIALAATAWLGPGYQVTSQINIVNPGGVAQSPHRDYHLGFMSDAQAAAWPVHAHLASPLLTLQGAVAHVDMPVETGPTKVLPHSQKYPPGYVVWKQPEVIDLFERAHVQLPLDAGDAVFFNPAVYHAAGTNRTADVKRMANLLQIGSAFGRSTEAVDRARTVAAIYPELLCRTVAGHSAAAVRRALAAAAEGYAFPTDLDLDPPIGGLAPATQADLVRTALAERWAPDRLRSALSDHDARRRR
jgi:ectoine hydroxylase-related dioxygenase (phytanoyl-CoA dioxygenase family)